MLIDLHAHYPMHVGPDRSAYEGLHRWRNALWRARLVDFLSHLFNYQGPDDEPGVTIDLMEQGDVGVVLSVLYDPFAEMDFSKSYGAPPDPSYFPRLVAQLESVEDSVASDPRVAVAHSRAELTAALAAGKKVLIHSVEGGFHLGATAPAIRTAVADLAARGVAYITLGHLFWRDIASDSPALPFLSDGVYRLLFPQRGKSLSELGVAAAEAMLEHRVLIDITHMSAAARTATLNLMDARDPAKQIPVLATHEGCRHRRALRRREYNLPDDIIVRIKDRGGVIGLILCPHYILGGGPFHQMQTKDFAASVDALCDHIDHIHSVTGSYDHIGIGSDLDGWIKPALTGLEHLGHMAQLQAELHRRYGATDADKICSGNAQRVLMQVWR
jgi:microsomal dipeptidase-like Zn-dependent dipeptidase